MRLAGAAPCLVLGQASLLAAASFDFVKILGDIAPGANATTCPPNVTKSNAPECPFGGDLGRECRTAAEAAPFLEEAFRNDDIKCAQEAAAIMSLVVFETENLRFKHNVEPGRPGQGTSNLQMFPFNAEYCQSIPSISKACTDLAGADCNDECKNKILAILTCDDRINFGSASWFIKTKCKPDVRQKLQQNVDGGFTEYMECVGVNATDEARLAVFERAKKAFGLSAKDTACVPLGDCQ